MKNAVKPGLFFGAFMSFWFIFSAIFIDKHPLLTGLLVGILEGAVSGLLFGFATAFLVKKLDKSVQFDLEPGEASLFQTRANHFKGIEAVGGQLLLTNKRLVFKSHSVNIQNHTYVLPLEEITGVQRYKSIGLINNGLNITTKNGTEKFVVDKAAEWLERLSKYNIAAANAF
jgi:hypothetical protein